MTILTIDQNELCAAFVKGGRCQNKGVHEEEIEPYADGRKVWITWCQFHWDYYGKGVPSGARDLRRS